MLKSKSEHFDFFCIGSSPICKGLVVPLGELEIASLKDHLNYPWIGFSYLLGLTYDGVLV